MIDPSTVISAVITGALKFQELHGQKEQNDIDCTRYMDNLKNRLATLGRLQKKMEEYQLIEFDEDLKRECRDKSYGVMDSIDKFHTWVYYRSKQFGIRKVVSSGGQSDDIRNLVDRINDRFDDLNKALDDIIKLQSPFYLKKIAEHMVINYSNVSAIDSYC